MDAEYRDIDLAVAQAEPTTSGEQTSAPERVIGKVTCLRRIQESAERNTTSAPFIGNVEYRLASSPVAAR